MDETVYKIPAQCTFLLYCEDGSDEGSITLLGGVPDVNQIGPGQEVEVPIEKVFKCLPTSWTTMSSDKPFLVGFRGKASAYSFQMSNMDRELMFALRRYPSENYSDFYMRENIQVYFIADSTYLVGLERISHEPEVFGSQLVAGEKYLVLPYSAVVVNTFTSGKIRIYGRPNILGVAPSPDRSNMIALHDHLDIRREFAQSRGVQGPRVLVIGPRYSFKTSLCYFLLNNAVKTGKTPVFIDLNLCPNSNAVPGAVSVLKVDSQHRITAGFPGEPKVLQFGRVDPHEGRALFTLLMNKTCQLMESMNAEDELLSTSGAVIDSPLMHNPKSILYLIDLFNVKTLVITANDDTDYNLYGSIRSLVPTDVRVYFILNQHRDVMRYQIDDWTVCRQRMREYFYGTPAKPRSPAVIEAKFSEVQICTVSQVSLDQIPVDRVTVDDIDVFRKACSPDLLNRIMAVSRAVELDRTAALEEVSHFVCVIQVDMAQETLSFLSPSNHSLTGAILIMGQLTMS